MIPLLTSPPLRQGGPEPLAVAVREPGGGVESGSESGGEDSVRGLVAEALAAEADEDWTAAFALYLAALRAAEDDDGRRLAFSAVGRLLGAPETPAASGLKTALDAFADGDGGSPARPWALRALVAAHAADGAVGEARRAAGTLAADYAGSEHARYGLAAEVGLALRAGAPEAAVSALASLEAVWPEARQTAQARGLVAAVLGPEALPEPGARVVGAEPAPVASMAEVPVAVVLLPVYPNPSAGATVVPFVLAAVADVRVSVYDVPGREVAVLVDGPREAGAHEAALDGSALPAGTYLVRLTAGGATATRRLTVAR